jgi:hypothetical protein
MPHLALWLLFAADPVPLQGFTVPPERRGDTVLSLAGKVDDAGAAGLAKVILALTVEGPRGLEVETPPLADAVDAWKQQPEDPRREEAGGRVTWTQRLTLQQVKPGVQPVPPVKVRFREGPATDWQEYQWDDVLKNPRDRASATPEPVAPEPTPAWKAWLPWAVGGALAVCVLGAAGWGLKRRAGRPRRPLTPEQRALQELDRLEKTALPPARESEWYHTQLSNVVRRYLAERFRLRAPQQTTAEFLEAVQKVPELPAEQQRLLRDFFDRCDLAKFARVSATPDECRRTTETARAFVRQTSAATPAAGREAPTTST